MIRKAVWISSSQSDVENVPLAETPAVSLHVGTEIEFRHFFVNPALRLLRGTHFELDFLRDDRRLVAGFGTGEAGDRAEMAACADQNTSLNLLVRDPPAVGEMQLDQVHGRKNSGAGAAKEVIVELPPENAITDRPAVS